MRDAVLLSFCNVPAPGLPLLGLFDPHTGGLSALGVSGELSGFKGITGIARDERYLYALGQFRPAEGERFTTRSALIVLDGSNLSFVNVYELRVAADAHSLVWSRGKMYVASSGTDQVVELELKGAEVVSERPYLQSAHGQLADINHINGLCDSPDGLIMSAFGMRTDASWASATNGFILDVKRRQQIRTGLQHPHTPFMLDGTVAFCESRKTSVETVSGDRRQVLPGYTRGICRWGEDLLVGTSVGRKTSRSTGKVVENPGVVGVAAGGCTINRLRVSDFGLISTFEAPQAVSEIYDLMRVEDVGQWPVDPEPLGEKALSYFAIYQRAGDTAYLIQDATVGQALLLVSEEASAKRLASLLQPCELRRLEGKDAVLEALDRLPEAVAHVAMDVKFDDRGGFFATRFVPLEQFRRG